jgi:hypothetical protein
VGTGVLAAAADWLVLVKYFNEPWGINTAYLTVGYEKISPTFWYRQE